MKKYSALLFIGFIFLSCSENINKGSMTCNFDVLIDKEQFNNAPSDQITINSIKVNDNCLKINFSSSGCSGDTWKIKLIDAGDILESLPPQRNIRFSFSNKELCEAYITKEVSFDITKLQIEGNQVQLNIANSGENVLYEY